MAKSKRGTFKQPVSRVIVDSRKETFREDSQGIRWEVRIGEDIAPHSVRRSVAFPHLEITGISRPKYQNSLSYMGMSIRVFSIRLRTRVPGALA